jgi:hypothetical protein
LRVTGSDNPYRGADGRYHFLYWTEHAETGNYYIGKHSKENLDDGYQGSGDWVKIWRMLAPNRLKTSPFLFFDSEEAAYIGERDFLTPEILDDPLCRNLNEGGDGRTSEGMRQTLARPEIKERHIAGVHARWERQEERNRASEAALVAFSDPDILAKYVAGSARCWSRPEEREKAGAGQRIRFAKPGEKEKQSARTRAYAAANPEARVRNSKQKTEQWKDPVWRAKAITAQNAGRAKMIAGPRAKAVETPAGMFPSLTAAAEYFGISRKSGARRVKSGKWRFVLASSSVTQDVRTR